MVLSLLLATCAALTSCSGLDCKHQRYVPRRGDCMTTGGEWGNFFNELRSWASVHGYDYVAGKVKAPARFEHWVWSVIGDRARVAEKRGAIGPSLSSVLSSGYPRRAEEPPEMGVGPRVSPLEGSWARDYDPEPLPKRERVQRNLDSWGHTQSLYRTKTKDQNARFWAEHSDRWRRRNMPDRLPPVRMPDGTTRSAYATRR